MRAVRSPFILAGLASLLAYPGCQGQGEDLSKSTIPVGESPTEKFTKAAPPPAVSGNNPNAPGTDPGAGLPR